MITVDMLDAIKVQFLKPIFEDDFVERGMTAWLTKVEWQEQKCCYKLFFDFSEFEEINDKYFTESYFHNKRCIVQEKHLYTAKEAGHYSPKYSVYFSCGDHEIHNDIAFADEIKQYLKEL